MVVEETGPSWSERSLRARSLAERHVCVVVPASCSEPTSSTIKQVQALVRQEPFWYTTEPVRSADYQRVALTENEGALRT